MSEASDQSGAPVWDVLQVRQVRATSASEAFDIAESEAWGAARIDTGEVGHTSGGRIFGVVGVPNEEGWDGLTANQALLEAAMLLIGAATQEGDDGTGGVQTIKDIDVAIDLAADVVYGLKKDQG